MICYLRARILAVCLSLLGLSFMMNIGISSGLAQTSTEPQVQAAPCDTGDQADLKKPHGHPPGFEKSAKMRAGTAPAHREHWSARFHRKNGLVTHPPVPKGIYSSGIAIQPADQSTPLMAAFWTADLVLPFTVPPQPPECELIQRPNERSSVPGRVPFQTVRGYVFPC